MQSDLSTRNRFVSFLCIYEEVIRPVGRCVWFSFATLKGTNRKERYSSSIVLNSIHLSIHPSVIFCSSWMGRQLQQIERYSSSMASLISSYAGVFASMTSSAETPAASGEPLTYQVWKASLFNSKASLTTSFNQQVLRLQLIEALMTFSPQLSAATTVGVLKMSHLDPMLITDFWPQVVWYQTHSWSFSGCHHNTVTLRWLTFTKPWSCCYLGRALTHWVHVGNPHICLAPLALDIQSSRVQLLSFK